MFNKVSKLAFVFAAAALVSCTQDDMEGAGGKGGSTPASGNLTTVHLAGFAADDSRVTYEVPTRSEEELKEQGTLRLVATIENPSQAEGFNFVKEDGGRWLSATSVYYNETEQKYYVTYHMQGNNYNTTLETETAGAIQSFSVSEDGVVTLDKGFRTPNPTAEDFDFNHLYFDKTAQRILAVGHRVKNGNQKNTNAVVGVFDPVQGTYKYATVQTAEKAYNEKGKSLGYKDAGDVNSVLRPNDDFWTNDGWHFYLLATRKGMAVVSADERTLFQPVLHEDGTNYFVATPGSAKSISQGTAGSYFNLLYLSEDTSEMPEAATTGSEAKVAHFAINTKYANPDAPVAERVTTLRSLMSQTAPFMEFDPRTDAIENLTTQTTLPKVISPVDGKNTLFAIPRFSDPEYYAALGTSGLYYHFKGNNTNKPYEGVMAFGNRPVNNVFADKEVTGEGVMVDGKRVGHDGFLYVANGSKLTILHRHTMEVLATWNMPSKDENGNEIASSANYVTVTSGPVGENGLSERTIAVAFGQAGVKIFKFMPVVKTVWEKDIY